MDSGKGRHAAGQSGRTRLDAALGGVVVALVILVDAADGRDVLPEGRAPVVVVAQQQDARIDACIG